PRRVGQFFLDEHAEIGADHFVTIALGGLIVGFHRAWLDRMTIDIRPGMVRGDIRRLSGQCQPLAVLLNLAENPGIRGSAAADHYGMASCGCYHGTGIFGRADIAVSDDGNLDRVLHRPNPLPASIAAVALLASAGVESDRREAAVLRHLRQLD